MKPIYAHLHRNMRRKNLNELMYDHNEINLQETEQSMIEIDRLKENQSRFFIAHVDR